MNLPLKKPWRAASLVFGLTSLVGATLFVVFHYAQSDYIASISPEAWEEILNDKGSPLGPHLAISGLASLISGIGSIACFVMEHCREKSSAPNIRANT
ncbi:MAG: hypothetical protein WC661_02900 [Opitutaceae bacterium]|jgi:hypothetical protein